MKKLYFLFLFLLSLISKAQNGGDLAQSFGPSPGFDGYVNAIDLQPDGKIVVGGAFTTYRGAMVKGIVRINSDGTIDNSFDPLMGFITYPSMSREIKSIDIQADGKILVGVCLLSPNNNIILRLNTDGSRDTTFIDGGTSQFGYIYSIATQPDGKILLGGNYTSYNGLNRNRIIRLNNDGTIDSTFNIGSGFNREVRSIVIQSDNKIMVGGYFDYYKNSNQRCIVRINSDGTIDNSFVTGTGFDFLTRVNSIGIQTDGKFVLGGDFTHFNTSITNKIIRLNQDGTKDDSFITGLGFDDTVDCIGIQSDGKILATGKFTLYNNQSIGRGIIRLNTDGTKDASFTTGVISIGLNNNNLNLNVIQNDNRPIIVGDIKRYNGLVENNIIRLNQDGTKDNSLDIGKGFCGIVQAIAIQNDGKRLIGGNFDRYNNQKESFIIRLNQDGVKDPSFNASPEITSTVSSIKLQSDGKLMVGHYSTNVKLTRLNSDGTKDNTFNIGAGFDNSFIHTIAIQNDGKILVGGTFSSYQGVSANKIIRLNPDGSKDTTFNIGTGFTFSVEAIVLQSDGKILVGGAFSNYNGVTENNIIRLNNDGTKDLSFNSGTGTDHPVNEIALQSDGKIIIGGSFNTYNGVSAIGIARLNVNGTIDLSFNSTDGFYYGSTTGSVFSIVVDTNNRLLVGGFFNYYNGLLTNSIVRINQDGSPDTAFNTAMQPSNFYNNGFNDTVRTITMQSDNVILIGGNFTTYKGLNDSAYLIGLNTGTLITQNFTTDNTHFSLYPNPVKDILTIHLENDSEISPARIYNFQGELVKETTDKNINVRDLSSGLYFLKIKTEAGEATKKLIKE